MNPIDDVKARLRNDPPAEAIRQDPDSKRDYIDGFYAVTAANQVFGEDGWSHEIITPPSIVNDYVRTKGDEENRVAIVTCVVRVKALGTHHDGTGVCVADGPTKSFAKQLDTAFKGCETDGLKRALKNFGALLGLSLYDKDRGKGAKGKPASSRPTPAEAAAAAFPVPANLTAAVAARVADLGPKLAVAMTHDAIKAIAASIDADASLGAEEKAAVKKALKNTLDARWKAIAEGTATSPAAGGDDEGGEDGGDEGCATDDELDAKYGDPEVRVDPKKWTEAGGASFKGQKFSECPADFLAALAGFFDWAGDRETDEKKKGYKVKDARLARGWARRNRQAQAA